MNDPIYFGLHASWDKDLCQNTSSHHRMVLKGSTEVTLQEDIKPVTPLKEHRVIFELSTAASGKAGNDRCSHCCIRTRMVTPKTPQKPPDCGNVIGKSPPLQQLGGELDVRSVEGGVPNARQPGHFVRTPEAQIRNTASATHHEIQHQCQRTVMATAARISDSWGATGKCECSNPEPWSRTLYLEGWRINQAGHRHRQKPQILCSIARIRLFPKGGAFISVTL